MGDADVEERRASTEPLQNAAARARQLLGLPGELALAALPTLTVLLVLAFLEIFSRQRLLFASLASSAFLIYLDPQHGANSMRTLVIAHLIAASAGLLMYLALGPGYLAGGSAMVVTIALMIVLDVVHPPAVSTSLSFAFRTGAEQNLALFGMALGLIAVLVALERAALWLMARLTQARRA
jgi:CBS-domain-containing membrane protein